MVVQLVITVGRWFQSLVVRGKKESLYMEDAPTFCLSRCEPLVLESFSWRNLVVPENSTNLW